MYRGELQNSYCATKLILDQINEEILASKNSFIANNNVSPKRVIHMPIRIEKDEAKLRTIDDLLKDVKERGILHRDMAGNDLDPVIRKDWYTWMCPFEELSAIIVEAIGAGYRHFDTATMYGQEAGIGLGVAEAVERGLINSRDEVFITSKLNVTDNHRDLVLPALKKTLRELKLEYVDLYLIHWPLRIKQSANMYNLSGEDLLHFDAKQVWEAMEECYKLGLAKSIGVSNFSCAKLSKLLEFATVQPSVNQVEMNVAWQQQKLVQLCKEKKICIIAYSPLGANGASWGTSGVMDSPVLDQIASSMNKTVAQVALRWIVEKGAIPIAKSFNKERMKHNLEVFEWQLSDEDVCKIETLIPQERACKAAKSIIQGYGDYNSVDQLWDGEI